jgi:hypothetical protein
MPLDDVLPPTQLPPTCGASEIVAHFASAFDVRVDVDDLDALPAHVRLRLTGVRLPEPPEAIVIDRALQVVPKAMLQLIDRILIVDSGVIGHLGIYFRGVIRLGTAALRPHQPNHQFGRRLSILSGSLLHEIGHAVYEQLTPAQRFDAESLYLDFAERPNELHARVTAEEAEHHFVALFVAATTGINYGPLGATTIKALVSNLGVTLPERR